MVIASDSPFGGTMRSVSGRELSVLGIEEFVDGKPIRVGGWGDPRWRGHAACIRTLDMTKLESSIDVLVPVATAYNQWTQFEEFPRFMAHVESIRQLDDRRLHWRVKLGGKVIEFDAEIVEQTPDKRIAWRSVAGARNSGVVTFHRLNDAKCRVMLQLEYEPEGFVENVGTLVGVPGWEIEQDLKRFAEFMEEKQVASGGWRGTILDKDDATKASGAGGEAT